LVDEGIAADPRLWKVAAKAVMTDCASHNLSRVRLVTSETGGWVVLCVVCAILAMRPEM
jgi:hypothetical protein